MLVANLNQSKRGAKRNLTSANFRLDMVLAHGETLADGEHIVGQLEGNIAISKVTLLVEDNFNSTLPTISVEDSAGLVYFTNAGIGSTGTTGSDLTKPDATGPIAPIYKAISTEFKMTIDKKAATKGTVCLLVEYVQLDTVSGKHA